MAEINVTPMVDVMLVLLVIFILAAPLFSHAIKLDLPTAATGASPPVAAITLSIDMAGTVYWNDVPVAAGELPARMTAAGRQQPLPELQLRADRATRYEVLAQILSLAQASGLTRIGFVTEPQPPAATSAQTAPRALQLSPALQLPPAR